jgi:hypothetical protein
VIRYLLALIGLALLVTAFGTGCSADPAPILTYDEPAVVQTRRAEAAEPTGATTRDSKAEVNVTATPTPKAPKFGLSTDAQAVVTRAREDLARRLSLPSNAVRLVSVESVKWPDASLGCPQPDQMYAQVITPGFRVVLKAAGQVYTYHADRGERLRLCQEESGPSKPTPLGPVEPALERLANQAKEDLAHRLSIPVEQIEVLEAKSVVWPDGGLGCPETEMAYTQVPQEGVLIRLRAEQRIYSYHGGAGTRPFLCERATTDDIP